MGERFYDSDFVRRVVKILQLKGGRGPSEIATEIVPVLDLTPLLLRAPIDLPSDLLEAFASLSSLGLLFHSHAPHYPAPVAGTVRVGQVFNPLASGKRVVLARLIFQSGSVTLRAGRFHNTPLTSLIDAAFIPPQSTRQGTISLTEIRDQEFLIAAVPATFDVSHYDESGQPNDLMDSGFGKVTLDPGQGFIYYPAFQSLTDAGPTPRDAIGFSVNITLIELPTSE